MNVPGSGFDAAGNLVGTKHVEIAPPFCGTGAGRGREELLSFDGGSKHVFGYVDYRCVSAGISCFDRIIVNARGFDPTTGRLYVWFTSRSTNNCGPIEYPDRNWLATFNGFPTTFEILQTYTPSAGALQFRVPYMPEGFQSADSFSTYWGNLEDLPDFTQAHPMACNYPASPPAVGTYLTVADTSPTPSAGRGKYLVTSVKHSTQRRYGRQLIAGVLSGRDPVLLPPCP
jgi:hypothetical protein